MTDTWVDVTEDGEGHFGDMPVGSDDDIEPAGYDPADDAASNVPDAQSNTPVDPGAAGLESARFPVARAAIPAWAKQLGNGQIPLDQMIKVAPIATGYLLPEAAAAWRNLQNAAAAAGFALTMTGAYRTLEQQTSLFSARYTTEPTGGSSKTWNNVQYWLKAGNAMAAVPGTSNHGWGAAVDTALGGYGNKAQTVGEPFLSWALDNVQQFGWSWEVQSEPWHLRLVGIESVPPAAASAAPVAPLPPLTLGSKGGQVAALQGICAFFAWGDPGRPDGHFGPRTDAAVRAMQSVLGVEANGQYDSSSAGALGQFLVNLAKLR